MIRGIYRCLVQVHPRAFRKQFEEELLWIFDQATGSSSVASLFADAWISLARQWFIRSGLWKWLVASALAVVPLIIAFGSFLPWDKPMCR